MLDAMRSDIGFVCWMVLSSCSWNWLGGTYFVLMFHSTVVVWSGTGVCYEIQYTWTARSTETETETGLDRYVMLGARWLTEYYELRVM